MIHLKIIIGFIIWGSMFWFGWGMWLNQKREEICTQEVRKERPDMGIVKRRCIETAEHYMQEEYYGSAAWFYLLGGDLESNLNRVEAKIDDDFYMNIGHTYVLKGNFKKAKKIYEDYIWYEGEGYAFSDIAMQDDYTILPRLYPDKKENLDKGLQLWNEVYAPINKIITAYKTYKESEESVDLDIPIKYLKQTIEYSENYKDKRVIRYWENLRELAQLYQDAGRNKEAIESYKKLETFYASNDELDYEYRSTLNNIAMLYSNTQAYKKGLVYYNKLLDYKEHNQSDDNASLAMTYKDIADTYMALKQRKKATAFYNESIQRQHHHLKNSDIYDTQAALESLDNYYSALANFYLQFDNETKAKSTLQAYITFLEREYEGDYHTLAQAHGKMAEYLYERNISQAIKEHLVAIEDMKEFTRRQYKREDQEEAVSVLFDYHVSLESYLLKQSDYNQSKVYQQMVPYMETLKRFQEETFATEPVNHLILAQTYHVMNTTYSNAKKNNVSLRYAQKALKELQQSIEEDDESVLSERHVERLDAYYNALLRSTQKVYPDANSTHISKEVQRVIKNYVAFQEEHFPHNFTVMSNTHKIIGQFLYDHKATALAVQYYFNAFNFAQKAYAEDQRYENRELLKEAIVSLRSVYSSYSDVKESIRLTQALIDIQKKRYADEIEWLSESYSALAHLYAKHDKQADEVVENYQNSINLFTQTIIENNSTLYIYQLRQAYGELSRHYADINQKEKSVKNMEQFIHFVQQTFPTQQNELARGYNALAKVYALFEDNKNMLWYQEQALLTLEKLLYDTHNYDDYFFDFEKQYTTLQESYSKYKIPQKMYKSIDKVKTMLKEKHPKEYDVYFFEMISYTHLLLKEYKKSMMYIKKANESLDTHYTFHCSNEDIYESYARMYIYLDSKQLKGVKRACGSR